jgi:flagellar FliL protein
MRVRRAIVMRVQLALGNFCLPWQAVASSWGRHYSIMRVTDGDIVMARKKAKKEDEEEEKDEKDDKKEPAKDEKKDAAAAGAEGEEGEEGKKKLGKKKLILLVVIVLVLAGIGGGVYWTMFRHKAAESAEGEGEKGGDGERKEGEKGEKGKASAGQPVYYSMPEFLVNLNSSGKQVSFLKMTIALELEGEDDTKVVEANLPRILDAFNSYLRELRAADVSGSAGLYRLREELLIRMNKLLAPTKVNDILFKEILVQ